MLHGSDETLRPRRLEREIAALVFDSPWDVELVSGLRFRGA